LYKYELTDVQKQDESSSRAISWLAERRMKLESNFFVGLNEQLSCLFFHLHAVFAFECLCRCFFTLPAPALLTCVTHLEPTYGWPELPAGLSVKIGDWLLLVATSTPKERARFDRTMTLDC
jgi:hypothetical protein